MRLFPGDRGGAPPRRRLEIEGLEPRNLPSVASLLHRPVVAAHVPPPQLVTTPPSGLTVAGNFSITGYMSNPRAGMKLGAALDRSAYQGVALDPLGYFRLPTHLPLHRAGGRHTMHFRLTDIAGHASRLDYRFMVQRAFQSSVATENAQPGSNWKTASVVKDGTGSEVGGVYRPGVIEGYVTTSGATLSARPGDTVRFHVNVIENSPVRFDVYRMGYYRGLGSRELATFAATVRPQPEYAGNSATGLVIAPWRGIPFTLPREWVSGIYVVKMTMLTGDRYPGAQSYMILVVRNDSRMTPILYQVSDFAWQAYNWFEGYNFYNSPPGAVLPQALQISFDRPYARQEDSLAVNQGHPGDFGSGHFFAFEYGYIQFLEAHGYDVSYVSGSDVNAGGANYFLGRKAVVDGGHDEYWTGDMWQAYRNGRDHGVNLLFFGGNQAYWHIRYDPASQCMFLDKNQRDAAGNRANLFRSQPGFGSEGTILGSAYASVRDIYGTNHDPEDEVFAPGISTIPGAATAGLYPGGGLPGVVYGETENTDWLTRPALVPPAPGSPTHVDVLASFSNRGPAGLVATAQSGGGLPVGQPLYWVVRAITDYGETNASNVVTYTATPGTQTVTLSWQPVAGALEYDVYRGTAPGHQQLLIVTDANTLKYVDAWSASSQAISAALAGAGALVPGQGYYWTVTALTPEGVETLASDETHLTATSGATAMLIHWRWIAGTAGYRIYRGTTPGGENQLIATISSPLTVSCLDTGAAGTTATPPRNTGLSAQVVSYIAPLSGARVFNAGTFGWNNSLYPSNRSVGALRAHALTAAILDEDLLT